MQRVVLINSIPRIFPTILFLLILSVDSSYSQVVSDTLRTAENDTLPEGAVPLEVVPDSLQTDSVFQQSQFSSEDMMNGQDFSAQSRGAELQSAPDAVNFQARDSLTFNFRGQQIANLFGSSNVRHSSGELSSGTIELDLNKSEVMAFSSSPNDTLSYPVLKQGETDLRSRRILFNYETEKRKNEGVWNIQNE